MKRVFTKVNKILQLILFSLSALPRRSFATLGVRIISRSEFEPIDSIAHCARSTENELQYYGQTQWLDLTYTLALAQGKNARPQNQKWLYA